MSVEFVDQAKAEALGAEFVALDTASDEAKVQSWFVMQAIADQVGEASNLGVRGVTWAGAKNGRPCPRYHLSAHCADGHWRDTMVAPPTLDEARSPDALRNATAMLARKIAEHGGLAARRMRPSGTAKALVAAVEATEAGRQWLRQCTKASSEIMLLAMVRVADSYGREGVYPKASLTAHLELMSFDDRVELVRAFPTQSASRAKAMSLRLGDAAPRNDGEGYRYIKPSTVKSLATRTGTTRREARVVLQAAIDGRSERKLMRLVREAVRTANSMQEVAA